jgi:hypothetical protein
MCFMVCVCVLVCVFYLTRHTSARAQWPALEYTYKKRDNIILAAWLTGKRQVGWHKSIFWDLQAL